MANVGRDIPHDSASLHVSGRSMFLDDVAPLADELIAGIVPAPVAHGRLKSINLDEARKIPGVIAILTAKDVTAHNMFGPVVHDEALIVEDEIMFIGQPLAIIGATSREALDRAKKAVKYEVETLEPIFTIDQAIKAKSYLGTVRKMSRGDVDATMRSAPIVFENSLDIGGQEHFYLESQIAIAMPGESGQMTIHSSTQHTTEVQTLVAEVLHIPFNHVTVICKRMGGGFGGKETQAAQPAMMAALLAQRTGRAVRFAYSKDDDMRYTGKRHPFKAVYKVGCEKDGRIIAIDLKLYANGGCSTDLSFAVLERAMLHSDNAYFLPNVRIEGRVCKTNLPSNTAFRGFGGPQGVAGIEHIIEDIAARTGRDALDIRQLNCYGITERNTTHYGQIIQNNVLPELFETLRAESNYDKRRAEIDQFNSKSKTQLRGMTMSAVKFGISFTRRTLNQANALVNIYTDGSVMVSTGATEMGQGVNTRIRQIVADELGVKYESVNVTATNTDKNNNTSPTAASSGTDLNGAAAADACRKLKARLSEFAARFIFNHPSDGLAPTPESIRFADGFVWDDRAPSNRIPFQQVICQAYIERINLGERGFYVTPGVDFNRETGKGHPFLYFTNGVACSEVLVDRFTGAMQCVRADILFDVGKSINPGIDRGQIVGAFIQGMGWVTTEELVYNEKGDLLSYSPTTYKIPSIGDLPPQFNLRFLDNPNNEISLYRSKAVGEPPLLLGLSVWLAARDAIRSISPNKIAPSLAIPATGERMLLAMSELNASDQSSQQTSRTERRESAAKVPAGARLNPNDP